MLACLSTSFFFIEYLSEWQYYIEERAWISEASKHRAKAKLCHFLGV